MGRPPPGVELELRDHESGARVAPGQVGEVFVRSAALMQGYLGEPPVEPGAFVSVGDLGIVDASGRLVLVDRKHDLVISGGVNVYPAEVERALAEHPDIAGAVVCGIADVDWGERVVALVAMREGVAAPAEDALRAFLKERIASYKIPKTFAFVAASELPIGPSGKPLRRAARAHFAPR